MVRKIVFIIAVMCVCLSVTSNALAYTSYDEGNMSTTYVQYFEDIVDGLSINHNYVAFRSGQYQYVLHASDSLRHDSGTFISDKGTTYTFDVSSGYNSKYNYEVNTEQNFSLDTNGQLVYSSIGEYPRLDERGDSYAFGTFFIVCVAGICMLVRPIYKYILRVR